MKRLYAWTRDLHLYLGLFVCPFILLFAVSTLLLNHPSAPAPGAASASPPLKQAVPIELPGEVGSLEQAKKILRQLNLTGEIDYVRHQARDQRLLIPVLKPGEMTKVEVDLRARTATVERSTPGLAAALIYLHKMPGPHNVQLRGNWFYMRCWAVLADAVVYGVLFLTVSGLYLWWMLKAERKVGWALLAAGVVSAVAFVAAICVS
ncbi:MAG: PepSY-associated TM helix domain-containing protein [Verrucomicrobia bacterium]|nr:PepSY-associated TM helix domain-containing protein [Verrucomicrobiota bacterium]